MSKANRLLTVVEKINGFAAPAFLKQRAFTFAFNSQIKFAGTTGIFIERWDLDGAVCRCKNRWRVQNHLGGIHATAMATLAESTTGMLFGLYVPDSHVPLLKSMKIDYIARASGDLKAVATITEEQKELISKTDKGSTIMEVKVTDSKGVEPIRCAMEWAWTTKRTKDKARKG